MVYILAILLIGIMLLSYESTGKDWLTPSTSMSLMFLASTIAAIYNLEKWNFELGAYSVFIILFSLILTWIINVAFHNYYGRRSMNRRICHVSRIAYPILVAGMIYTSICLFLQYRLVTSLGMGNFNATMHVYRMATSYGLGDLNITENYSLYYGIATAITYISLFNLIYFFKNMTKLYRTINILQIIAWSFIYFLQGERGEVVSMAIYGFVIFYMAKTRLTGRYKKLTIKQILKIIVIVILALYAFYAVRGLVGRKTDSILVDYITSYLGGSIPCFDLFIKEPGSKPDVWGQETFYAAIEGLIRRGFINSPQHSIHREFRSINGVGLGNVYTALRAYYFDFGFGGLVIIHTIYSVLLSWLYEKAKACGSIRRLITLSMVYDSVILYEFNNSFFGTKISISFFVTLVMVFILYDLFVLKKIHFNLYSSKHIKRQKQICPK